MTGRQRVLTFEAAGTHLYPGAKGVLRGGGAETGDCMVTFSDGAAAFGSVEQTGPGHCLLALDACRTGAGTGIGAKRWRVAFDAPEGGVRRFRILDRAADQADHQRLAR